MTKRNKKQTEKSGISDLVPKDADYKYYGYEPHFVIQPENNVRDGALAKAFTWYSRFFDKKDAKVMMVQYLEWLQQHAHAKVMNRVNENEFMVTLCWLARMNMRGLELTPHEVDILNNEVKRLLETTAKPEVIKKTEAPKPNVQEIMRSRAQELCGELEGIFDECLHTKNKIAPNTIALLNEKNILPQHVNILIEAWTRKLFEFQNVLQGKDKDLMEGYNHLSKTQIKNIIKFCEIIINDLHGYVVIKKTEQPARKKKVLTPQQLTKNVKFQVKDEILGLRSVAPSKLIDAEEIWVYDTSKRKLSYYVADQHVKTMSVKGNMIVGFDNTLSGTKTLRKPEVQLKDFLSLGKVEVRKFFKNIKTVQTIPSGRMTSTIIILKVN